MSLLGRYLDWFGDQRTVVQVGTTTCLFVVLFAFGVVSAGVVPAVVLLVVLVDHWYRGTRSSTDDDR